MLRRSSPVSMALTVVSRRAIFPRLLILLVLATIVSIGAGQPALGAGGIGDARSISAESSVTVVIPGLTPDEQYRFIVTGTYVYDVIPGEELLADAECSLVPGSSTWTPLWQPEGVGVPPTEDWFDVYVDGDQVTWEPLSPPPPPSVDQQRLIGAGTSSAIAYGNEIIQSEVAFAEGSIGCDPDHGYSLDYTTPSPPGASSVTVTFEIQDPDYGDNEGSLELFVACVEDWGHQGFIQQGATNDLENESATTTSTTSCPNGVVFSSSSFRQNQNADYPQADSYQCPKAVRVGPRDEGRTFGIVSTATVTIDSRDNVYDPIHPDSFPEDRYFPSRSYTPTESYYSTSTARYYKQTGHWGIRTCNWLGEETAYRIVARGVYKYDQSAPPGYALADPECSTGYPENTSTYVDAVTDTAWDTSTVTTAFPDGYDPSKFVPGWYRYFLDQAERNADTLVTATVTGTVTVVDHPRPYAATSSGEFDRYGGDLSGDAVTTTSTAEWEPDRYLFWPTEAQALPSVKIDPFDLHFGVQGYATFTSWAPLEMSGGSLSTATASGDCSSIHTYYTEVTGTGTPLHLAIWDLVRYNEWDNCGTLSISITDSLSGFTNPPEPVKGPSGCHYVSDFNFRVDMFDAYPGDPERAFYFHPTGTVVNQSNFQIASTGTVTDTVIMWRNENGAHTITSAVDENGDWCGRPVIAEDANPTQTVGRDQCDRDMLERPFDYSPDQIAAANNIITWQFLENVPDRESFLGNTNVCRNGYCNIPYFCRIVPDKMRGTILVKLDE